MTAQPLSQNLLLALFNELQNGVFVLRDTHIVYANDMLTQILGYEEGALLGTSFLNYVHEDDKEALRERNRERLHGEPVETSYSFKAVTRQGENLLLKVRVGIAIDAGEKFIIGSVLDVTKESRTMIELARSQSDISSILANMPDVFYRTDMEGIITVMSPSCFDVIGYKPEEMIGQPLASFYYEPVERKRIVEAIIAGNGCARSVESHLRRKDGSPIWVSTNAYIRLGDDLRPECIEGIARDITDRKALEEKLAKLAKYDSLTNLLNRRSFIESYDNLVNLAKRHDRPLSVAMMDLDHFKSINDNHGHHVGDLALSYFAGLCLKTFRHTDIIGRIGGEEFAVALPETDIAGAKEMINRLRDQIKKNPVKYDGGEFHLSFSGGLVRLSRQDADSDATLIRADNLLYQAKEGGRDRVVSDT
jgi:diguanylate cyclase (GGDEF)-like protein/PAS domain S-box-containing protein